MRSPEPHYRRNVSTFPWLCPIHQQGAKLCNDTDDIVMRSLQSRCQSAERDDESCSYHLPEWPHSKTPRILDPSIEIDEHGVAITFRDPEIERYSQKAEKMLERMLKDKSFLEVAHQSLRRMMMNLKENGSLGIAKYNPYPDLYPAVIVLKQPGSEIFHSGQRQVIDEFELVQTQRYSFDESGVVIFIPQRQNNWVNPVTRTAEKVKIWKQYRDKQLSRGVQYDIDGHPFGDEPRAYVRAVRSRGLKHWWVVARDLPAGIGIYVKKSDDEIRCIYQRDVHRFVDDECKCLR